MNEMEKEYYDRFEIKLQDDLLRLCTSYQQLDGVLIASEDIDGHWNVLGPQYLADAVEQVRDYPIVSVAWAAYLGTGVAWGWDADWAAVSKAPYQLFYGEQGFDDMDEHIVKRSAGISARQSGSGPAGKFHPPLCRTYGCYHPPRTDRTPECNGLSHLRTCLQGDVPHRSSHAAQTHALPAGKGTVELILMPLSFLKKD